ncbi:MAG: iron ABC transporter permease, partial [Gemmatimonadota bacterium]|nr:iron ABC transporter permease [Gemmatimonadota bacterium]
MRRASILLLLGATLAAAALLALAVGAVGVSVGEILEVLGGGGDARTRSLILGIRLPRVVLAVLVGGGLAVAGAVFQALLRNPLADPYILGVSGGAAVGAVSAVVLGGVTAGWSVTAGAMAGAVLAVILVLRIALATGRSLDSRILLLAGVIVGAFFNAVILLLLTLADAESFRSAVFWMMGRLWGAGWAGVAGMSVLLVPCLAVILALSRPLDLMAAGEETAGYLGVPVERMKLLSYLVTSLLVAAAVSVSGVIGFVGLIVPHAVRL